MTRQPRRLTGTCGALAAIVLLIGLTGPVAAQELTGRFETIDTPDARFIVRGIAADGRLVGYYGTAATGVAAFLLTGDTFMPIDVPFPEAVGNSSAQGINARGDIVGIWTLAAAQCGCLASRGFLLEPYGGFSAIEVPGAVQTRPRSINASGEIVGWFGASGLMRGFIRDRTGGYQSIEFPGAIHTIAHSINDRGDIVGRYFEGNASQGPAHDAFPTSAQPSHGFLLTADGYTPLDVPFHGGFNTGANGINAAGDIVGCYTVPGGQVLTFVRDRHGEYRSFQAPGASFTCATAINARGDIAGHYIANGRAFGFVLHKPADK